MTSHRLLLVWGATLSFVDKPASSRSAVVSWPGRAVLSLECGGTAPRLPPSYATAEPYAFGCVRVHRDTTLACDIYPPRLLILRRPLLEMTPLVCPEAGEARDV